MNRAQEILVVVNRIKEQTKIPQFVSDKARKLRKQGKSDEEISKILKIRLEVIKTIK